MTEHITTRTPKWYIDRSLEKTVPIVFSMMRDKKTDAQIGEFFGVKETTIRGFLTKKIPKQAEEFRSTLPLGHPRAKDRSIRSAWLVNNSRQETSALITQHLVNGASRGEIAKIISKLTGFNVSAPMVSSYIANHMNVNFTQSKFEQKQNEENRFFSQYIVGTNPAALDRLMGVA